MDFRQLRENSRRKLISLHLEFNPTLPLLEHASLRSQKEIENRALALFGVVAFSYGLSSAKANEWILQEGVSGCLTPAEKSFTQQPSDKAASLFQVQVEALWIFAWMLSRTPVLDFAVPCQNNLVALFPDPLKRETSSLWRSANRLRDEVEVAGALDLAYCIHWSFNQSRIEGRDEPDPSSLQILRERRRALEWSLGEEEWDAISLDT